MNCRLSGQYGASFDASILKIFLARVFGDKTFSLVLLIENHIHKLNAGNR